LLDFEPLTGTTHLPPPFQQTFECRGFVICTFAPRYLDHHPQAIKVPYVHSNVEADEVLFYVDGEFGFPSWRGPRFDDSPSGQGSPHGPHPGTIMKSMSMDRTEEMAVMFDTDRRLLIAQAFALDDPKYPRSWLETPTPPPTGQYSG
jgi:homogentisate 1,2-dioxygenase